MGRSECLKKNIGKIPVRGEQTEVGGYEHGPMKKLRIIK